MKKILLFLLILISVNRSLSASEVSSNARETENLIANGSFESTETVPSEPDEGSNPAFNIDIWKDNVKPTIWNYQRWNTDQPAENFNGEVLTDSEVDGTNAVKIGVSKSNSYTQAFFKQVNIPVDGNTFYDISFWAKLDNIVGRDVVMRVEQFNGSGGKVTSTDYKIGTGSSGWSEQEITMETKGDTRAVNIIFVIPSSTTGAVSVDDVYFGEKDVALTELKLDEEQLTLSSSTEKQLNVEYVPEETSDRDVVWSSSDDDIASVSKTGLVSANSAGEATITVKSVTYPEISAKCNIEVKDGDILVDKIEIVGSDLEMTTKKKRFLEYKTYPSTAVNSDLEVKWESSDSNVFTVASDSGLITAISPGTATLTVASSENPDISGSIKITVKEDDTDEQFILMKDRWVKRIIGDNTLNLENKYIADYVEKINNEANSLWEEMDTSTDRSYLWPLQDGDTSSADITTQFKKINKLSLAFGIKGSDLKENRDLYFDIVEGLKFMTTTKHYDGTTGTGNWWDCQIGSAQKFTDTLMIMGDYMGPELVEEYATIIGGYAQNPAIQWGGYTATGANRTDIGLSVLGTGILLENEERMELIDTTIPDVFKLVTSGDGLYADGSIIQHNIYAYSGSYGNELMKGIGRILEIISGTEWEIEDESINNVYETILNGYIPLMSDGRMMSMVSGRSVSRPPSSTSEFGAGSSTIANMMVIASFAPEEYSTIFKQNVKAWIEAESGSYDFFKSARDLEALQNADEIMNDENIVAKNTYTGTKVYSMDRAVQVSDDYSVGISMYSNRTGNYELQTQGSGSDIKYENMQGWHQADGVMYLYNDDYDSYDAGYWATIDSKRLPGTTVSTSDLALGEGKGKKSDQPWVGGASNSEIGAVGMQLDKATTGTNLTAKKSWFLLDGAIIALGSDINGTSDDSIQTVVDNRKIGTGSESKAVEKIVINGDVTDGDMITSDYNPGSWMNIKGKTNNSSIGYYFPEATNITTLAETNTESFKSVNTLFVDNKDYTDEYFKILINHGSEVIGDTYAYVVLPGKSAKETEQFAKNNSIEILRNDETAQAIVDKEAKILMMNVWDSNGISTEYLSVDKPSSIVIQINGDKLNITMSEPSRKENKVNLTLTNDVEIISLIEDEANISVSSDLHHLEYNSPADGSSSTITFKIPMSLNFSKLEAVIK